MLAQTIQCLVRRLSIQPSCLIHHIQFTLNIQIFQVYQINAPISITRNMNTLFDYNHVTSFLLYIKSTYIDIRSVMSSTFVDSPIIPNHINPFQVNRYVFYQMYQLPATGAVCPLWSNRCNHNWKYHIKISTKYYLKTNK